MANRSNKTIGNILLAATLAAVLVSGGILAACTRTQTTTSAPTVTSTSASTRTTTSVSTATTTSAPVSATTSVPAPTGASAADLYKSNVVTLIVPYGPGGTTDLAARFIANFWTEVTGGRMIVQNKEGAGGISGSNFVYSAKPDGLTLGVSIPGSTLIASTLAQDPAVKYDLRKMNWVEYTNPDVSVLVVGAKSPYASMDSLSKAKGLKFASSSRSATISLAPALIIDLFNIQDGRIVLGYSGTTEAILAVAKGEVDGYVSSGLLDSVSKGLVKQPLLTMDFQRSPYFPDAPTLPELMKLSAEQENLLRTFTALVAGQVFWFQPGVPTDRIEFVRNAFDKIVANETFVKQAKTVWPVWVKPTGGKDFAAQMEKSLAVATPDRFAELLRIVDKYTR